MRFEIATIMPRLAAFSVVMAVSAAQAGQPHVLAFDLVSGVRAAPYAGLPRDGDRAVVSREAAAGLLETLVAGGAAEVDHARVEMASNDTSVPHARTQVRAYLKAGAVPGEVAPATVVVGVTLVAGVTPDGRRHGYAWRDRRLEGPDRGFRDVLRDGVRLQEPVLREESGKGEDTLPIDGVIVQRSGDEVAFLAWD